MHGIIDIERTIGNADSEFPALYRMFGGYFHQDWQDEHATAQAAAAAFSREAQKTTVNAALAEIVSLQQMQLPDDELGRLLTEGFDCNYRPRRDGLSNAAWLELLAATLQTPQGS
ncbi:MAG: hypothetical protein JOY68_11345 [Candidatus Dormibacteraeota bacterium]|nr:hypothetical protein [Candidatus Dormibacteraeota bacterium]